MEKTELNVIHSDDPKRVAALDWMKRFDEAFAADYVAKGQLMVEGRDDRHYEHLDDGSGKPFESMESFCNRRYGLSARRVREYVECSIVYQALAARGDSVAAGPPVVHKQMMMLCLTARMNTEQRPMPKADGTHAKVSVPVGVANIDEVADEWNRVNKAFDKKLDAWKEKKEKLEEEGKRVPPPPKLSGPFVHNHIARKYQRTKEVAGKVNFLVRLLNRFEQTREDMEQHGCFAVKKLEEQILKEPALPGWQLDALKKEVQSMTDALEKFSGMLDQYESVE